MTIVPTDPRLFHITHVDNLAGIIREGGLLSDNACIARELLTRNIAYSHIKERRRNRRIKTPSGGTLADYVPFNFCPRSVMLFAVHRGHDDYQGGQANVVHLSTRASAVVGLGRAWLFTDRHAELGHAQHYDDLAQLGEVSWSAMRKTDWRDVREVRQAEFLVREFVPWSAIDGVGCHNPQAAERVRSVLARSAHKPPVTVEPKWYYEDRP
jgi:hypothetical protein